MNRERLNKVLRMIESPFDGERTNAARVLSNMAAEAKQTVPEFLMATLGVKATGSNSFHGFGAGQSSRFAYSTSDVELSAWRQRASKQAGEIYDLKEENARLTRQLTEVRRSLQAEQDANRILRSQLRAAQQVRAEPAEPDCPPWAGEDQFANGSSWIDPLEELLDRATAADPFLLTEWEVEFTSSMAEKFTRRMRYDDLTPSQQHSVDKLLKKLKKENAEPLT